MPRKAKDYSKGKIYKLECLNTGKVYVGHTTYERLSQRLAKHRGAYNEWKKGTGGYTASFKILEGGNYQITLLESYPCKSEDEITARERYWFDVMEEQRVNKNRPRVTEVERQDAQKVYNQVWREAHIDELKQYYETNREALINYQKTYRETHGELIAEKRKQ